MSETWPIEDDDAIALRGHVQQSAGNEVLDHAAIAMQHHQHLAFAPLEVVQLHTVDLDEGPWGGLSTSAR